MADYQMQINNLIVYIQFDHFMLDKDYIAGFRFLH
jgi:hypothetical protein